MKKFNCIFASIIISATLSAQSISEGFDNVFGLYTSGNWFTKNNSNPNNGNIWYQDAGNFTAYSGATNSSITAGWYCTDTVGTGDASVWLFTPPVILNNGDSISFYTISYNNAVYPDRMELRLNTTTTDTLVGTTETSVGNYTTLLLTINPSLDFTSYPMVWTKYSVALTGMSGNPGRIAFRYMVPNTGGSGTNGSVVGIDDFYFKSILTSTHELESESALNVFPNPALDQLTVNTHENSEGRYSIYDASGKIVLTGSSADQKINVAQLDKGIYTIKLITKTGSYSQKFVKE
jgi:Secretion system C-terminal sorting domain